MQTLARSVLHAIGGARHPRTGGIESSGAIQGVDDGAPGSGATAGEQRWTRLRAQLRQLSSSLRRLEPLRNLDCQIGRLEDRYRGEGSIPDAFLADWVLANVPVGPDDETLATVVVDLLQALDAPQGLTASADAFASSYCGFYRIVGRCRDIVHLKELVTEARFAVRVSRWYAGAAGAIWWVRLLPNPDGTWTAAGAPFVFRSPDAGDRLGAYFRRTVGSLDAESYRMFLRRGSSPYHWFELIKNVYIGADGAAYLEGVPNQPRSLPYPPAPDSSGGDECRQARGALLRWAELGGWTRRAVEAFRTARQHFGLPDEPPVRWSEDERAAAEAYALYGHVDDRGRTALEVALTDDRALFGPSLQAHLQSVYSGWFSVFEVVHDGGDAGLVLRDLVRRRHVRVEPRSLNRVVTVGDALAGWLAVGSDGVHRMEGAFVRASASLAPQVVKTVRYLNALFRDSLPELPVTRRLGLLAPYVVLAFVGASRGSVVRTSKERRVTSVPRRPRRRPMARQLALFDMRELAAGGHRTAHAPRS